MARKHKRGQYKTTVISGTGHFGGYMFVNSLKTFSTRMIQNLENLAQEGGEGNVPFYIVYSDMTRRQTLYILCGTWFSQKIITKEERVNLYRLMDQSRDLESFIVGVEILKQFNKRVTYDK